MVDIFFEHPIIIKIKKKYKINNYITLKLVGNEKFGYNTYIYVDKKEFIQCKYLLLNININKEYDKINSIDDAEKYLNKEMELNHNKIKPEEEFWGHCSNLQVWVENDYDTRLLHSNLSFPLLKKLVDIGDPVAKKVFKEEIANRFNEGNQKIKDMLFDEYFKYLTRSEIDTLLTPYKKELKEMIKKKGSIIINDDIYVDLDVNYIIRDSLLNNNPSRLDTRLNQKEINLFLKILNSNNLNYSIKNNKIKIINIFDTISIKILSISEKLSRYNYNFVITGFVATINNKYIITHKDLFYRLKYEPKYDLFKFEGDRLSLLNKLNEVLKNQVYSHFLLDNYL